jgi:benzil reductase ((S)-benzoin forming)
VNCAVITGTSRGLGEALALQMLAKNYTLFCISRKRNELLIKKAVQNKAALYYHEFDLCDYNRIDALIDEIFNNIDLSSLSKVVLINNAATLDPIGPIGKVSSDIIVKNYELNMIAPALLSSGFIRKTKDAVIEKMIVSVSSGAAVKPYYGWSPYCSSKAALELFTKCVAVEQQQYTSPVKCITFNPGVMNTEMQEQIRRTPEIDFINKERFLNFYKEGRLVSPETVAAKLIALIESNRIENGNIYNVNEL